MDFSLRLKKVLAGASVAAMTLTQVGTVAAYNDVPAGVWYGNSVDAFVNAGYLDSTQARFRAGDPANRAEFVKLVVELNGGILSTPPAVASFNDASTGAWYYGYFEEAGKEGWLRGDGDCYGSNPCYARPGANINRAEAAALIVRAFGLAPTGDAPQFVDNPSGQWYTNVIQTSADHCVLQGDDATGRVRPGDNMNRAEMVVMLYRVDQGLSYGVDCGGGDVSNEPMITDAVATSSTTIEVEFNLTIEQSAAEDTSMYTVMNGSALPVTSADLLGTSTVELTLGQSLEAGHSYTLSVTDMMTAAGTVFSDSVGFTGYTAFVQGDGTVEVSLAASNPVGDTVPKGGVGIVMLSVDFTASCEDSVAIENLTILHEGFGAETDIDGLYAAVNGARVTRKRTIDSEDQTSDLRFSSPLILDPCETVTVDVVTDFSSTATVSAEHNLVVELPSDVFGNAKAVTGNFPLRGDTFRVAAVTSGVVSVEYRTVSPDEVEVGDVGVVIGKFEVSVNSTEDQTFYSMTLEQNSSSSDGDFVNIAVRRTDGTILTNTVSQTVGDFVTLVFDPPFTVLEGDKITLEVIADVVGGAGDTIIIHFEESSDLFAVGSLYGYGVNGQLYGSQISLPAETASLPDTVSIDAGEFTIGIDGPSQQDYTRDDNDAILANMEFQTGGEDIDVKDFYVLVQGTTSTGGVLCANNGGSAANCGQAGSADSISEVLEDVEIRNKATGRTIDGVRLTGSSDFGQGINSGAVGTYQIYRFDDFIVRGDEEWEFRVDFIDNGSAQHPASGDKFRVHLCGEPTHILSAGSLTTNSTGCDFSGIITSSTSYQMQVEGLSTGDKVGDVRPRGTISGNFHQIATATLVIAVKEIGTGDTAVENSSNILLLRFEARAGEAEDILFTKSIFESASGSLNNGQNYALWVDTDGDGQVDTILEDGVASQSSQVSFGDLAGGGYVIPAEETVVFEVRSDISSSLTGDDLLLAFDTGSSVTYIEAEELDDGSNLSGIETNGTCTSTCDVIVTTAKSQPWVLRNSGDLYVNKDSAPLRNRQLLGGTLGEAILRLELHAEHEPIDVTDIQFTSSGSDATSIDRIELYRDGEATKFAEATKGGCGNDTRWTSRGGSTVSSFCVNMESQQLVIPDGADVDIIARPRLKTDEQGAVSNQILSLFIGSGTTVENITVQARGNESSNDLSMSDGDSTGEGEIFIGTETAGANAIIVGNKNLSVLSKITSITNANPDANGTTVPTGISAVGQFKFTAAAHNNSKNGDNDVILSGVVFNVNATNVSITNGTFKMYNKADQTKTVTCTEYDSGGTAISNTGSGTMLVECRGLAASTVDTQIDEGTDSTFVLQADISNPNNQAGNGGVSVLQVTLQRFDDISNNIFGAQGASATRSHIQWRDSDQGATTPSFLWVEYPETSVKSTSYNS